MRRAVPIVAACLAMALAVAGPRRASADVLVGICSGDQVKGSFLPASEVESYVVRLPAGSKLSATVAGKLVKGVGPVPVMTLLDPDGAVVPAAPIVVTKTGAKLVAFVASASGDYTIRLTANAEGDYALKVKRSTPMSVAQTMNFGITPSVDVPVHAIPGSAATIRIAALAFQPGFPRIERVRSDNGTFDVSFPPPPPSTMPVMLVKGLVLGGTSCDYIVTVSEPSDRGSALFTAQLVAAKMKARKVDLTTRAFGSDPLTNFVQGTQVGPAGGTVAADVFPGDPLAGSSVAIPAGAFAAASVVVLGPASEIAHGTDLRVRGPAVRVGPAGTKFAVAATVTLPFDAGAFDSSHTGLTVLARDDHGLVTTVPAGTVSVDDAAGTVSFPALRVGSFQVFGPAQ